MSACRSNTTSAGLSSMIRIFAGFGLLIFDPFRILVTFISRQRTGGSSNLYSHIAPPHRARSAPVCKSDTARCDLSTAKTNDLASDGEDVQLLRSHHGKTRPSQLFHCRSNSIWRCRVGSGCLFVVLLPDSVSRSYQSRPHPPAEPAHSTCLLRRSGSYRLANAPRFNWPPICSTVNAGQTV